MRPKSLVKTFILKTLAGEKFKPKIRSAKFAVRQLANRSRLVAFFMAPAYFAVGKVRGWLAENAGGVQYTNWVGSFDTITERDRLAIAEDIRCFPRKPAFSILMPVYNPKPDYLRQAINSVLAQLYPEWELCIADDCSTDPKVQELLDSFKNSDPRIKICFRTENGNISQASNTALQLCSKEFTVLMDHDDVIPEHSLYMLAKTVLADEKVDLIYTDEDKIDGDNRRFDPYFKTDFDPYKILVQNYVAHLGCYRTSILKEINGFRVGYEGSQDYDLLLRFLNKTAADRIVHLPYVLYHWRKFKNNASFSSKHADLSDSTAKRALTEYLSASDPGASVEPCRHFGGCWNVSYKTTSRPLVSIIIPNKDSIRVLKRCIDSILKYNTYPEVELIIVDNGSNTPELASYYSSLRKHFSRFNVIDAPGKFNYSSLNNRGAAFAHGEFLLLLNNDIEFVAEASIEGLLQFAQRENVGAVGCKLLYPNGTIQHAGIVTGIYGGACHPLRHHPAATREYFGNAQLLHSASAITGACLMVSKAKYLEVGGLDETLFAVSFNDVDFGLKLRHAGFYNLYVPTVSMIHHESVSRGADDTKEKIDLNRREYLNLLTKYGPELSNDPFYNPNFSLDTEDVDIAKNPRIAKPWKDRIEFVVPFHRGDVLLATQVAVNALKRGIKIRLHVADQLVDFAKAFAPELPVAGIPVGMPEVRDISHNFEFAEKFVLAREDCSGRLARSHKQDDFRRRGLDIIGHFLEEVGMPVDCVLENAEPEPECSKYLSSIDDKTVLIHPNGGWNTKSMPPSLVEKIAETLHCRGYRVVQIGGEDDPRGAACDGFILCNGLSVGQWSAILKAANCIFCVDSWFSHLASVLDVKTFVFFGSTHPKYISSKPHFKNQNAPCFNVGPLCDDSPCDSLFCKYSGDDFCSNLSVAVWDKIDMAFRDGL